jgi:hypothetical protein
VPSTMPARNTTYAAQWEETTITRVNATRYTLPARNYTVTGTRGSDNDNTNPINGWSWAHNYYYKTSTSNICECSWLDEGNVFHRLDGKDLETDPICTGALLQNREITYRNGLGITGSATGTTTSTKWAGLGG